MKRKGKYFNIKNGLFLIIIFLVVIIELFVIFDNTQKKELEEDNNTIEHLKEIKINYYPINDYSFEFYQWKTYPIHYYFSDETYCGDYYKERMIKAFNLIEEETDYAITFYEEEGDNAIKIVCDKREENDINGAAEAITFVTGKEITNATIRLYKINTHKYIQNGIETETHEILHTLNFDHIEGRESIMNPIGHDYDIKIDKEIIECIKYIYAKDDNYSCKDIPFIY